MTYKDYLRKLRATRTQEDVDKIVHAACKDPEITAHRFGKLMIAVKARRAKLPGRN